MIKLLAAGVFLLAHSATAAQTIPLSPQQRSSLGIEVAAPQAVTVKHSTVFPARVAVPNAQLQVVTAPHEGLVEVLLVAEGESVRKGQPLVRIQSPDLLELQSDYLETLSRYSLVDANYRRDRQLHDEGIIAERRLLETRSKFMAVSTELARLRRLLELAGMDEAALTDLRKRRELSSTLLVRAPLDGIVLEQMVTAGNRVAAADPLYRIADLDPLWLEIHVPLEQLGATAPGDRVLVPELDTYGTVITVGRMVHSTDQGVLVRAELADDAGRLHPGQFLQVQLASPSDGHDYRVPRAALARVRGRAFLFAAGSDGFTPVAATVVSEQSDHLIVRATLPAGAAIAVNGAAVLKAIWQGAQP
ncbi:MAG: efflux RND transporter periplasmic adaptor subunit [Thiogranum sp.]|jgi:RND family efflux transporter MFP subunit